MNVLTEIRIENLKSFENNPFIFREDTAFEMLIESISNLGVLTPIIVRSIDDSNYEIISGHRRVEACRRLGIETRIGLTSTQPVTKFRTDEIIGKENNESREMRGEVNV